MQQAVGQVPAVGFQEIIARAQIMGFIVGGGFSPGARDAQDEKDQQQDKHRQPNPVFPGGGCEGRLLLAAMMIGFPWSVVRRPAATMLSAVLFNLADG